MEYEEVQGDLFSLNPLEWKFAHCISADVTATKNMNKGIAKIFREKYPEMAKYIQKNAKIGIAVRFEKDEHVIYNLIPKEKVGQKAKGNYQNYYYNQLQDSLLDMRKKMLENNEAKLAMPRIASGLDGGNWEEISKMIKKTFEKTQIKIEIRYL